MSSIGTLDLQVLAAFENKDPNVARFIYEDAAVLDLPGIGRISGVDALSRLYVWLMDSFDKRELILQSVPVAKVQLAFGLDGNLALKGERVAMSVSATADKDPLGKIKYLKVEGDLAQLWRHCEKVSGPVPR
ncbi:hypothetical protein CC1G_11580 [Coprinopsis cinerea okayama7|uniref:SnoaL-like domain-containing protein n=1 Tax=Coprinopsis cinerea (strain Okayama-7 / 130 / ATCC MYA-4618 / FGSC 9003) TaxID=240176 RepID=A8N9S7_COPC7|nr:hypothetical protein CC1G_11580 [Coprinopsis cinerea okayama7\|eukprot:XP_001831583.2 hypothetical protein CC1G_11580 [Coprinopsis cinerea okayama7\